MRNQFFKDYFSFTRKERNAVLVLLILVVLFFIIPSVIPTQPAEIKMDSTLLAKTESVRAFKDTGYYKKEYADRTYRNRYPERRYYPKAFKRPLYNEYKPYPERKSSPYQRPAVRDVYINDADSSALLPLPGIGPRLAGRIITFRDKLGGFYSIDQIAETYGLPDSTFQQIKEKLKLGNKPPVQININTAEQEQLKQHPYIRWNLANAIVQFRKQHGAFKDLSDLLKIAVISSEILEKIAPYLTTKAE